MDRAMLTFCSTTKMVVPCWLIVRMISNTCSTYPGDSPIDGSSMQTSFRSDGQGHVDVLLDHEDGRPLLVDRPDDLEHLLDIPGRQPHRRLVHADQLPI